MMMHFHADQPVIYAGKPLTDATSALIVIHGRGAAATDFAGSVAELGIAPEGTAIIAPQASNSAWYPQRFMAPLASNEPHLSSALDVIGDLVSDLLKRGFPSEKIALLGFSQGACLTLEFAARNARRFGALVAFSGGLIGPEGTTWDYTPALAGTPVFLGCGDGDSHIPVARVQESTQVLTALGAVVEERIYPGFGHSVNDDEISAAAALLAAMATQ